jgi:hypothetical protein
MIVFVEKEEQTGTGATFTLLIFLGLTCFLGNLDFFKAIGNYIVTNPGTIILVFGGYLLVGLIWSFVKWYFYLSHLKDKKAEDGKTYIYADDISFLKNKSRILVWMSYWPLSGLWTLINDPMRKLFQFIQMKFAGTYQKMATNMFKGFEIKS